MKNLIDFHNLREIVSQNWGIGVNEIEPAPRGFVAETFFIKSGETHYFVKVIDAKSRYTVNILDSLPIINEIRQLGIRNIPQVIPTTLNAFAYQDDRVVIIVFERIMGDSSRSYGLNDYFALLQRIHGLTPSLFKNKIKKESFDFHFESELRRNLNLLSSSKPIQDLTEINSTYIENIYRYIESFKAIINKCKLADFDLRITHGDAPGNIIVSGQKLYLIDWDDILLAPIERDLWYHKADPHVGEHYPHYKQSDLAYSYYVLLRFLDDLSGFLDEIFKPNATEQDIMSNAHGIIKDVTGWLLPLVKDTEKEICS